MKTKERYIIGLVVVILLSLTFFATKNYNGNLSSLLRIGKMFSETHEMPSGLVAYDPVGYDGELYYQMARNIPQFFLGNDHSDIPFYDNAYRWQRILLPMTVYGLSFGNESWFPNMFIRINLIAIILSFLLTIKLIGKLNIHTLTSVFNPAALVGLLFCLTEPLSLLFITAFLLRWKKKEMQIDTLQILFLTLALFARETTLFLIVLLMALCVIPEKYRQVVSGKWLVVSKFNQLFLLFIPIAAFTLWQVVLYLRLGEIPMANGSGMVDWKFLGTFGLIGRAIADLNPYVLSSLAFLFLFVLPLLLYGLYLWFKKDKKTPILFILGGLTVAMLSMNVALWGVLTSIGRVITPIYPVYAIAASESDSRPFKMLSASLIAVSIILAVGIVIQKHMFVIS
ncbi:hypothetical protein HOF56_00705 [Candidatus Peribacteria bacterium]|jgi:hypothetical protein|nr:hypothetical protein [Candidatus Peribacteria bacterium]MBT4021191.1 hypothetical protein [Candidatus Peribacteria bacterium]MBT4240967.1 hypothetical protein [Candidatus Peribacteria bacterium]MBT4474611.1 hypothetical protein [Candidatus Peribacteria bacterium]